MKKIIEEAIEQYNKYHSPEVEVELLSMNAISFQTKFTGSFCSTCGFFDYFDDYTILLEELGLNATVVEVIRIDKGAIVKFNGTV